MRLIKFYTTQVANRPLSLKWECRFVQVKCPFSWVARAYGNGADRLEPKERDRLRVLHEVQKTITQIAAAKRLKIGVAISVGCCFVWEHGDRAVCMDYADEIKPQGLAEPLELRPARCARLRARRYADFRTHPGRRALGRRVVSEPRDAAQVDDKGQLVVPARAARKDHQYWRERRACFRESW